MTWYDEGFCDAVNLTDYRMRPDPATGYPGRTHRERCGLLSALWARALWLSPRVPSTGFYTGTPVFAFGAGLSYTSFDRSLAWGSPAAVSGGARRLLAVDASSDADDDSVVAKVDVSVSNTGERSGDEVVLLFVVPPPAAVALGAPKQQLASFGRLSLEAGTTATITLPIARRWAQAPATAFVAGLRFSQPIML